ncbi:hypothetical protein TUM12370_32800 [Salmonella enterica subsp. enterica serovar Choleraesuis]|nr:hypothetical protein TUM12370_32800 [Salmonella enterica subsp. enterica serovar Choleraesuis]
MTEQEREAVINEVLARLRQPSLVVIQAATGYQREIIERLSAVPQACWHVALTPEGMAQHGGLISGLGCQLDDNALRNIQAAAGYRALLLPFLDGISAANLASGCLRNLAEETIHRALMMGKPVLALRCHLDPQSELNQIRGLANNPGYQRHVAGILQQLQDMGITFCSLDEMARGEHSEREQPAVSLPTRDEPQPGQRFTTLREIQRNPGVVLTKDVRLTDAAADYLKSLSVKPNIT